MCLLAFLRAHCGHKTTFQRACTGGEYQPCQHQWASYWTSLDCWDCQEERWNRTVTENVESCVASWINTIIHKSKSGAITPLQHVMGVAVARTRGRFMEADGHRIRDFNRAQFGFVCRSVQLDAMARWCEYRGKGEEAELYLGRLGKLKEERIEEIGEENVAEVKALEKLWGRRFFDIERNGEVVDGFKGTGWEVCEDDSEETMSEDGEGGGEDGGMDEDEDEEGEDGDDEDEEDDENDEYEDDDEDEDEEEEEASDETEEEHTEEETDREDGDNDTEDDEPVDHDAENAGDEEYG